MKLSHILPAWSPLKLLLSFSAVLAVASGLPIARQFVRASRVVVPPYVQLGTNTPDDGSDSKIIAWVTSRKCRRFHVKYGQSEKCLDHTVAPLSSGWRIATNRFKYVAQLDHLPLDDRVFYEVDMNGHPIRHGSFMTSKSPTNTIHFVAVGDTADFHEDRGEIAREVLNRQPDFLLHLGDIVYMHGSLREYENRFWNIYNARSGNWRRTGAPLMSSVPFSVVLGNHDVYGTNQGKIRDGLAAFFYFHAPQNGPTNNGCLTPLIGTPEQAAAFKAAAGKSYPALCAYSFDDGPAHFLCLDGNTYVRFDDPGLHQWIEDDLHHSHARWKFVACHQPAFCVVTNAQYFQQQLRTLWPVFEHNGVDVVFSGHVHNYQRSVPIRFNPQADAPGEHRLRVDGHFKLDQDFDGQTNQHPDGIIQIVSGGGGAKLYDATTNAAPQFPQYGETNWVPYTARFFSIGYSFSDVVVSPDHLTFRQLNPHGVELDRFEIAKHAALAPPAVTIRWSLLPGAVLSKKRDSAWYIPEPALETGRKSVSPAEQHICLAGARQNRGSVRNGR